MKSIVGSKAYIKSPPVSVAIVDDHSVVMDGLSRIIDESDIARITETYHNLKSCREGLAKEIPDVLLLDIGLKDGNGVDFCAEVTKAYPALKVIMLTCYKEFNIAKHALHNGASGYILKESESEELLAGIETVSRGEQFLCKEIDVLLKDRKKEEAVWVTNAERLVLKYLKDGYTRKKIAEQLQRKEYTIKTHIQNMMIKFGAKNMAELIKKACEMGLI